VESRASQHLGAQRLYFREKKTFSLFLRGERFKRGGARGMIAAGAGVEESAAGLGECSSPGLTSQGYNMGNQLRGATGPAAVLPREGRRTFSVLFGTVSIKDPNYQRDHFGVGRLSRKRECKYLRRGQSLYSTRLAIRIGRLLRSPLRRNQERTRCQGKERGHDGLYWRSAHGTNAFLAED